MELSIIIPVHNAEAHIGRCLESILIQTGNAVEVLVIDDASTDASLHRIRRKASGDPRVRLFTNDANQLAGYCRNQGIQHARGSFLWFVDADDWVSPGSIARLMAWVQEFPETEVFSFGFLEYYCPTRRESFYLSKVPEGASATQPATRNFLQMRPGYTAMPFSYLFRRSFLLDHALRFPEGVFFEDLYFMARVFFCRPALRLITHIFYTYNRSNTASVTSYYSGKKVKDLLQMYSWIRMFYGLHECPPAVLRLLRIRFLLYGLPRCYRMYLHMPPEERSDPDLQNVLRNSLQKHRLKRREWVSLIRSARTLAGRDVQQSLIFRSNLRLLLLAQGGFRLLGVGSRWIQIRGYFRVRPYE